MRDKQMPVCSQIELLTKENILKVVRTAKCPKLKGISHGKMTREQLIDALKSCDCPVIKKLIDQLVFV